MSDYLANIAAKSLNLGDILRPRPRSTFEPLSSVGMVTASPVTWEQRPAGPSGLRHFSADKREGEISGSLMRSPKRHSLESEQVSMKSHVPAEKRQGVIADPSAAGIQSSMSDKSWQNRVAMNSGGIGPDPLDGWDGNRLRKGHQVVNSGGLNQGVSDAWEGMNDRLNPANLESVTGSSRPIIKGIAVNKNINDSPSPKSDLLQSNRQIPLRRPSEPVEPAKAQEKVDFMKTLPSEILRISDYIRASSYGKSSEPLKRQIADGEILVSIGRIEIRSSSKDSLPERRQSTGPGSTPMGLNEYLYKRARGGIG